MKYSTQWCFPVKCRNRFIKLVVVLNAYQTVVAVIYVYPSTYREVDICLYGVTISMLY